MSARTAPDDDTLPTRTAGGVPPEAATLAFLVAVRRRQVLGNDGTPGWSVLRRWGPSWVDLDYVTRLAPPALSDRATRVLYPLDGEGTFVVSAPDGLVPIGLDELRTALARATDEQASGRRIEAAPRDGEADLATGLGGKRTWRRGLAAEDLRCGALGHPAAVVVVGLDRPRRQDGPDEEVRRLARTGTTLRRAIRGADLVCCIGERTYAVLAVECAPDRATALAERVAETLLEAGIGVATAAAARDPGADLAIAYEVARARLSGARGRRTVLGI